jgi:hypothetical protein
VTAATLEQDTSSKPYANRESAQVMRAETKTCRLMIGFAAKDGFLCAARKSAESDDLVSVEIAWSKLAPFMKSSGPIAILRKDCRVVGAFAFRPIGSRPQQRAQSRLTVLRARFGDALAHRKDLPCLFFSLQKGCRAVLRSSASCWYLRMIATAAMTTGLMSG